MHVYKRGSTYHFKRRIPVDLVDHPFFQNCGTYYSKSLGTDSLKLANKRALSILAAWSHLRNETALDKFEHWFVHYQNEAKAFAHQHSFSSSDDPLDEADYRLIKADEICQVKSADRELKLHALFGNRRFLSQSLRSLCETTIAAKQATGRNNPRSVIAKIRRGTDWLLASLEKSDLSLEEITWELIHQAIAVEVNARTPSNTLHGYLYGLRQIWKHAQKLDLINKDKTPFDEHDIQNNTMGFDAFTVEEVRRMYAEAAGNPDLQLAIKIGYTTGARAGEVCDIRRYDAPSSPCPLWAIKFSSRGKTDSARRLLPIHPNLIKEIPHQFSARWSYKNLIERGFKKIKERAVSDYFDSLTLKPRRLGFHSFRVMTTNTLVYEAGFSLATASEYTGHKPSRLSAEGAITGYLREASLETKLKMANAIPWIFD